MFRFVIWTLILEDWICHTIIFIVLVFDNVPHDYESIVHWDFIDDVYKLYLDMMSALY